MKFAGKRALITGGARGQGRSHAVALAREGCNVAVLDIACGRTDHPPHRVATEEDLAETARLIEEAGAKAVPIVCDVSKEDEVRAAVETAVGELGGLDHVVANAGVEDRFSESWTIPTEDWTAMIAINLTGVWLTCKYTIPHLITTGRGASLILVSSLGGLRGIPYNSGYTAAKFGVVGLAQALTNELGQFKVRCNVLHPGSIDTPMTEAILETNGIDRADFAERLANLDPLNAGLVSPEESTTPAVLWLLSEDAKWVNGHSLVVDAGTLAKFG